MIPNHQLIHSIMGPSVSIADFVAFILVSIVTYDT